MAVLKATGGNGKASIVLLECARDREMAGGLGDGGIEGGRQWRGRWVDDGGTVVPVAWTDSAPAKPW